jgi:hypothetical protein
MPTDASMYTHTYTQARENSQGQAALIFSYERQIRADKVSQVLGARFLAADFAGCFESGCTDNLGIYDSM